MRRRVVVETPKFLADLSQIGPEGYDWSDSMLGIRWYLERGPERVGDSTQDVEVRILMFDTPDGIPDLKIFFQIGPDTVQLLSVKEAEPDPF